MDGEKVENLKVKSAVFNDELSLPIYIVRFSNWFYVTIYICLTINVINRWVILNQHRKPSRNSCVLVIVPPYI